jgi:hypothetical protein
VEGVPIPEWRQGAKKMRCGGSEGGR